MRKILLALTTLLTGTISFAQKPVSINGVLKQEKPGEVKLFAVREGNPVIIARSMPEASGRFGFLFYPETEGVYLIGTGTENSPVNNYAFYFKQGDKLNVEINDSTYQLLGNSASAENKVMNQWFTKTYPLMRKTFYFFKSISTYEDFFPQFGQMEPQLTQFIQTIKTRNPVFNQNVKDYLQEDIAAIAIGYLNTPRTKHPTASTVKPDFYNRFKIANYTQKASLHKNPFGNRLLRQVIFFSMQAELSNPKFDKSDENLLNRQLSYVVSDTLKGEVVLTKLETMKSYTDYLDMLDKYKQYLMTDIQKKRAFDKQASIAEFKPGIPGYNFKYPDPEDKEFSLASFKGKVVLLDIWATWCGPCKVEIPHLKALEEEMKGKDVAIVSISVDEEKDKEKWKKFIVDQQLGGTQLYAKGWSDITKFYQITGIPRFLLFDKDGKLITHDAPRPSKPALKQLINKYL